MHEPLNSIYNVNDILSKKKMLMTSDARKIKVSNVKGIKVCLSHYKMRLRFYGGTYNSQDILGYCLKSV